MTSYMEVFYIKSDATMRLTNQLHWYTVQFIQSV